MSQSSDASENFNKVVSELDYGRALLKNVEDAKTPLQKHYFLEANKIIKELDGVLFSGDVPYIYFKCLTNYDEEKVKKIHKYIWNQNRVPFLFIITPSEIKIYNCYEEPAQPLIEDLDSQKRLLIKLNLIKEGLEKINTFSKLNIDTGNIWQSEYVKKIDMESTADVRLLENLKIAEKNLFNSGLNVNIIHNLIGRSLFILYLEDRNIITKEYYKKFNDNASEYLNILLDKSETYELFEDLADLFNGDLFPIETRELNDVSSSHLTYIRQLFLGTELKTGQTKLWRPYDFSVIPIELISSIYEYFLTANNEEKKQIGAIYTPHFLVEFMLNEVLPWPTENDHNYMMRILDPACGSGIFLVEAFRRLVFRWKFTHNKTPVFDDLRKILLNNIFGIDIQKDAIKVAALSLSLALFDFLEPDEIWKKIQLPKMLYSNINPEGNLFNYDTIKEGPFERNYDLIIGNIPWKRDGLKKHEVQYLRERGYATERALAFLWRCRDFTENGKIVLISTSKMLFNSEKHDKKFRSDFFTENKVEMIVDLSILNRRKSVKGKKIFSAQATGAIIFYRPIEPTEDDKVIFCTPKPGKSEKESSIIIDKDSIKFLPLLKIQKYDYIWKVALWGHERDFDIISKMKSKKTIKEHMDDKNWVYGRGYQPGNRVNKQINNLPFLDAKKTTKYYTTKNMLGPPEKTNFAWFGAEETYKQPHILLKKGLVDKSPSATFLDYDCSFRDAITGISDPENNSALLKVITLFINSQISTYYLFLTSSEWGINRGLVHYQEILSLPGIPFEFDNKIIALLSSKYDEIKEIISKNLEKYDKKIYIITEEIDGIFYDHFNLTETDLIYIEDIINYQITLFHTKKSMSYENISIEDMTNYATFFCNAFNDILQFDKLNISAKLYYSGEPLNIIEFIFSKSPPIIITVDKEIKDILKEIELKMNLDSTKIYYGRNLKLYDKNSLLIIKPSEKRYWSKSQAINDAIETINDGLRGR